VNREDWCALTALVANPDTALTIKTAEPAVNLILLQLPDRNWAKAVNIVEATVRADQVHVAVMGQENARKEWVVIKPFAEGNKYVWPWERIHLSQQSLQSIYASKELLPKIKGPQSLTKKNPCKTCQMDCCKDLCEEVQAVLRKTIFGQPLSGMNYNMNEEIVKNWSVFKDWENGLKDYSGSKAVAPIYYISLPSDVKSWIKYTGYSVGYSYTPHGRNNFGHIDKAKESAEKIKDICPCIEFPEVKYGPK